MYTIEDLKVLEKQEEILQFNHFDNETALELGLKTIEIAKEYDREVSVSIIREADELIVFCYYMNSKKEKNTRYMLAKRKAARECGHNSFYPYVENRINGKWQDICDGENGALACSGAYPIRVNNEWTYTLMVSGLHEGKDFELVLRGISEYLNKEIPVFSKKVV